MDPLYFSSKQESELEQVLFRPYSLMPLLFECPSSDLIVYTHDLERRLTYMSESSWHVCRLDFQNWQRKSFVPMFTENPWNDVYRNTADLEMDPCQVYKIYCEIWDDEGGKARLEVRRKLIMADDEPIGVIGVSRRIAVLPSIDSEVPLEANPFSKLSPGEMDVIEQVIAGHLNKSIAKSLGLAMRTVELRRAKAMTKLGVSTLADLVKLWCKLNRI
jgi:DNA-binding CsgD family transcriptional regulator